MSAEGKGSKAASTGAKLQAPQHMLWGQRLRSEIRRVWWATTPKQLHIYNENLMIYCIYCVQGGTCRSCVRTGRAAIRAAPLNACGLRWNNSQ